MKYTRRIVAVAVSTVVIGMLAMSAWVAFPSEDLLELAPPLEHFDSRSPGDPRYLYTGRVIWNASRFERDPDSGSYKRLPRPKSQGIGAKRFAMSLRCPCAFG
jgi:hypothetical protein